MTTNQLTAIMFPSLIRARQRLRELTERGVLARFRRYVPLGSGPWTYTLGLIGAAAHAVHTEQPLPTPGEVTTRIVRLHHAPTLDHLLGVNEFFAQLHAAARGQPGTALTRWWSESVAAGECGGIVRPDGYGEWTQHPHTHPDTGQHGHAGAPVVVKFFYEHDTGTETLNTMLAKLDRYEQLAAGGITRTVLIQLPSLARENNLHQAIRRRYGDTGPRGVPVATTHTNPPTRRPTGLTGGHGSIQHGPSTRPPSRARRPPGAAGPAPLSPVGPVWWLIGTNRRRRLAALAPTTGPTR
jgi:hypothetical protein